MSRRPSLPGAAELFRATGAPAPAEVGPARDPDRAQRLRPASRELDEPGASERTASVTQLTASALGEAVSALAAPAPARVVDGPPGVAPAAPPARPAPVEPAVRGTGAALDDDASARRARSTTGVRQTRRQRMRTVGDRRPSGRERHEEKITVYCSAEELLDLESARLTLRGEQGLVVDRGRIVREAVAIILADLDAKGEDSILVRRLRES